MWSMGSFIGDAPELSRQNYDDFTETQPVSIKERAKRGNSAKMKTIKIKRVTQWLKTLNTWTDAKWEALLADVKKAVEESIPKKRCGGSGRSSSPIEIIEEDLDDEIPASDPPDVPEAEEMDVDELGNGDMETASSTPGDTSVPDDE